MAPSNTFLISVFLAVIFASAATFASPFAPSVKHATHHVRHISEDLKLETFHPESTYEIFGAGVDHPLSKRADATMEESAIAYIQRKLSLTSDDVNMRSAYRGSNSTVAYVQQRLNGIPVANALAHVAFNRDNKVVAFGSSFMDKHSKVAPADPSILVGDAIKTAESALKGSYETETVPSPTLEYLIQPDDSVRLTHVFQVRNGDEGTWYEAFVDAHSGELLSVTDFVATATYRVLPINKQILTEGFETLTDPEDTIASPQGWLSNGRTATTETAGNNAIAFKNRQSNTASESAPGEFVYTQDPAAEPTAGDNLEAALVNAFYLVNTVHDIAYRYGFTEDTFNFQNNNFGNGGRGNDRVAISVQDRAGKNNAQFSTPPDGQSGQMSMFLWDLTSPERDGALENDIVVHENTHGITNRLTGGGTGRCLQTVEAGGLGEGWSDAFAEWTEQKNGTVVDFVMGQFVIDNPAGIRSFPYSTNPNTNPLRYSSLRQLNEVHQIGEVWANMLHNVYATLVDALGFSTTAFTDPTGTEGNVVFLHLFLDALALQPCNPTFINARDAWIQADEIRYNGANSCLLWTAFASRGLGLNAKNFRDGTSVPTECRNVKRERRT